jgi:FkbM family methyltransferase
MKDDELIELLKPTISASLGLIDVGARWGIEPKWRALADISRILGFEPDAEECDRLNSGSEQNVQYLPFGLAEETGEYSLYITMEPACSSMYPPRRDLYENYPCLEIIKPASQVSINCRPLDQVMSSMNFGRVDAIKLDTQGTELSILKGAVKTLQHVLFLEVEVEFNPLYEGQPLFHEVDAFLRAQNFTLWRFDNLVHYSRSRDEKNRTAFMIAGDPNDAVMADAPGGQLFWAQAIYVKEDLLPAKQTPLLGDRPQRAAILALVYGARDLAFGVIARAEDPSISDVFRHASTT